MIKGLGEWGALEEGGRWAAGNKSRGNPSNTWLLGGARAAGKRLRE